MARANFIFKTGEREGQTLVETIVALSVLTMGLMGLIGLLSRSFAISNLVSDNYTATYLAAEGIEIVRDFLEHNARLGSSTAAWNDGFANGSWEVDWASTGLVPEGGPRRLRLEPSVGIYDYVSGAQVTKFTRTLQVSLIDTQHLRVNSIVRWRSSGGITGSVFQSEVNLEDHFFSPY